MPDFSGLLPQHTFFMLYSFCCGKLQRWVRPIIESSGEAENFRVVVRPPKHNLFVPPPLPRHTVHVAIFVSYQHGIWYLSRIHLFNNLIEQLNLRDSVPWTSLFVLWGVALLHSELRTLLRHVWSKRLVLRTRVFTVVRFPSWRRKRMPERGPDRRLWI